MLKKLYFSPASKRWVGSEGTNTGLGLKVRMRVFADSLLLNHCFHFAYSAGNMWDDDGFRVIP
jgi:hypothetical protein